MQYRFRCPECGQVRNIDIKMSDYDKEKNNQMCSNCGSKLERVIEFEGSVGKTGGYDAVAGKASWQ